MISEESQLGAPPTLSHLLYTNFGPGFDAVGRPLVNKYGQLRMSSLATEMAQSAQATGSSASAEPVIELRLIGNVRAMSV
jgi:hypothetical protein